MLIKNADMDKIIAWRNDQPIYNQEFRACIAGWKILLEQTPGNKFALYLKDSFEFACALFGAWLAEKIIYLPNNILPHICKMLNTIVDGYIGEFPAEYSPIILESSDHIQSNFLSQSDLIIKNYMGLVIYTSGSTGEPQAIQKNLSQLFTEISTLENLFGNMIGAEKTEIISTVSHEHIYGLLFKILWPLVTGRVIHIQTAMFLEELAPILNSRDCVLITSPAHLKRFPHHSTLNSSQYSCTVFSSAGPLAFDVAQTTQNIFGQMPIEIYGSTETGGIAWRQRKCQSDESWRPMPDLSWRIKNDLLEISSRYLLDHQWFCTADYAAVSSVEHKNFLLYHRSDRIVKLEGKRISLNKIEQKLLQSPLVLEARALMSELNNRQYIAAFIVLSENGQNVYSTSNKAMLNKHLRNFLADSIERIALPRAWRYLSALPTDAQGKVTHSALIALLDKASQPKPIMPEYILLESDKVINKILLELTIPQELLYFDGHFPETPILPGVVQIHWAIIYGRQYFNLPICFQSIQKLKFQRVIQPRMKIRLELIYDKIKLTLLFRFYSEPGQHASGSILFND